MNRWRLASSRNSGFVAAAHFSWSSPHFWGIFRESGKLHCSSFALWCCACRAIRRWFWQRVERDIDVIIWHRCCLPPFSFFFFLSSPSTCHIQDDYRWADQLSRGSFECDCEIVPLSRAAISEKYLKQHLIIPPEAAVVPAPPFAFRNRAFTVPPNSLALVILIIRLSANGKNGGKDTVWIYFNLVSVFFMTLYVYIVSALVNFVQHLSWGFWLCGCEGNICTSS